MKCRICASECPPGANLCRDCAAARKRAFAATVTQPLLAAAGAPSVGRPRFAPRPERRRPERKKLPPAATAARSEAVMAASAAEADAAPRKPIGVQWLLLALAVASAILYLIIQLLMTPHGPPPSDTATPSDSVSQTAPGGETAPAPAPPILPPSAALAEPPQPAALSAEAKAAAASALKSAAAKAARRKAAKAEAMSAVPVAPPPPAPEPAAAPRVPAPTVVEAPRDPWQAMNDGLSRCAREDWISRGACEQRLRLQYCPGHWGMVWQCPIGPPTDHG
jgi:hypothetical protein